MKLIQFERLDMIYDDKIYYKVVRIFGLNSEVYKAMMSGEKISALINKSYNSKGTKKERVREKRMLFEECRKIEEDLECEHGLDSSCQ